MDRYRAIIFDLGNVIFNFSFDKTFEYWARISGYDTNLLKQRFQIDKMYHQFERGEIEPELYRNYLMPRLGLNINDAEFDNGWNDIYLDLLPGIEDLLQDLRVRYRLFVLTNTNKIHASKWRTKYKRVLINFEKIFCSFELGARKPEKRIYERVLDFINEKPGSIIFFDDNANNITGAIDAGIKGILVSSTFQIIDKLVRLGIRIDYRK